MTIAELQKEYWEKLNPVYGEREAKAVTRWVLEKVLALNPTKLSLERFRLLTVEQQKELHKILERLAASEPVQYVLGEADFMGMKFSVNANVLIPRPETEELVYWIMEDIGQRSSNTSLRILDIGTGSGCIPIALARQFPLAQIEGMDISRGALDTAEANNRLHQTAVQFRELDILTGSLPAATYDIIISNPPYITESEKSSLAPNVVGFEPHQALFAPGNGLVFYETIAHQALPSLTPGGKLYVEINATKGGAVAELLVRAGFNQVTLRKDISGNDRMIRADK